MEKYQIAVNRAKLELQLAKAKLAYFTYLTTVCDLYDKAADFIVNDMRVPSKMEKFESQGCKNHIEVIQKIETQIYQLK